MKRLSIIIVTYNSEADIYDCIGSIKHHADIPLDEIELVVVDNGSSRVDEMFSALRVTWGDDIILLRNTHNGGYGQGNNIGIRQSTAPVILIMNPDVRLMCPCLAKPLTAFETDPTLCMYGMKQMFSDTRCSTYSFMCTYRMNGYLHTLLQSFCNRIDWYLPRWQFFSGSCFFIQRAKFEQVGLFDESVFMYGEEEDIHWRLKQRFGLRFHYDHTLCYMHLVSQRPPSADYEMKLVHAILTQNEKKGYARQDILRQFIRQYRLLYVVESLKTIAGGDGSRKQMLSELLQLLRQLK